MVGRTTCSPAFRAVKIGDYFLERNTKLMGRNPKSMQIHVLEGTYRPDRHAGTVQAEPVSGDLRPPSWLSIDGKRVWRRYVMQLTKLGTLSGTDVDLFASGCQELGTYIRLTKELRTEGMTYMRGDLVRANPKCSLARLALAQATILFSKFGMSPVDRMRIRLEPQAEENDAFTRFLEQASTKNRPRRSG
ncbi:MAG TPA: phage terminase small subunit P27 family [bacterium]|nr:phage terminase small subunit P27 family [bacterium]HQL63041.1 phage terminase small subunit P27 family [bacterium]